MMTLGEAMVAAGGRGIISEDGFMIGFDISEGQELLPEDFTAAAAGVSGFEFELSPKTVMREYVDGHRAVPLSEMRRFVLTVTYIAGDPLHMFLADAAESSDRVRYAYADALTGTYRTGTGLVRMTKIKKSAVCGLEITFVIENG